MRFCLVFFRFHLRKQSLKSIQSSLDCPAIPGKDGILACVKSPSGDFVAWGLEHIVSHVNWLTLESYKDMVSTCTVTSQAVTRRSSKQVNPHHLLLADYCWSLYKLTRLVHLGLCLWLMVEGMTKRIFNFPDVCETREKYYTIPGIPGSSAYMAQNM